MGTTRESKTATALLTLCARIQQMLRPKTLCLVHRLIHSPAIMQRVRMHSPKDEITHRQRLIYKRMVIGCNDPRARCVG